MCTVRPTLLTNCCADVSSLRAAYPATIKFRKTACAAGPGSPPSVRGRRDIGPGQRFHVRINRGVAGPRIRVRGVWCRSDPGLVSVAGGWELVRLEGTIIRLRRRGAVGVCHAGRAGDVPARIAPLPPHWPGRGGWATQAAGPGRRLRRRRRPAGGPAGSDAPLWRGVGDSGSE
jgi:hypothetical protein